MSKESKGKNNKNRLSKVAYLILGLILLIAGVGMTVYRIYFLRTRMNSTDVSKDYNSTYVFVVSDIDDEFMREAYYAAKEAGKEKGVYVELMGNGLRGSYNKIDYLTMAIASKPDGIIVEADESPEIKNLINDAKSAGIPVVTMLVDSSDSERKAFIGPNYYDLGKMYGTGVYNVGSSVGINVTVLIPENMSEANRNNIYQGILAEANAGPKTYSIDMKLVNCKSMLTTEEDVRNIIYNDKETNIFIATNPDITTCTYQALIDYNKISSVKYIGYYKNASVIKGISTGAVDATVILDSEDMGNQCVQALYEYINNNYVSSYIPTGISLIDKSNVENYLTDK